MTQLQQEARLAATHAAHQDASLRVAGAACQSDMRGQLGLLKGSWRAGLGPGVWGPEGPEVGRALRCRAALHPGLSMTVQPARVGACKRTRPDDRSDYYQFSRAKGAGTHARCAPDPLAAPWPHVYIDDSPALVRIVVPLAGARTRRSFCSARLAGLVLAAPPPGLRIVTATDGWYSLLLLPGR
jgi:hypothetical protein